MNTKDKVPFYVNQCHEMGIEVLPPDVNESDVGFTVVEDKIRFGLNAVKGVGVGAIESILAARAERPVRLASTTSARASTRASSTSARWRRSSRAAPSTAPATRAAACSRRCRRRWPPATAARKDRGQGQGGLFDLAGARRAARRTRAASAARDEFDQRRAAALREGGARPLRLARTRCRACATSSRDEIDVPVSALDEARDGALLWTGGIIAALQRKVDQERRRHGSSSASKTSTAASSASPGRPPASSTATCSSRTTSSRCGPGRPPQRGRRQAHRHRGACRSAA